MGNEPSKDKINRQNAQNLTSRDVEAILEKQRQIYEKRYQEFVTQAKTNSPQSQDHQTRRVETSMQKTAASAPPPVTVGGRVETSVQQNAASAPPRFIPGGVYPLKSVYNAGQVSPAPSKPPPVYPPPRSSFNPGHVTSASTNFVPPAHTYNTQPQASTSSATIYPNLSNQNVFSYPANTVPASSVTAHRNAQKNDFVFVYSHQAQKSQPNVPQTAPRTPTLAQTNTAAKPMIRPESRSSSGPDPVRFLPSAPSAVQSNERNRSASRSRPTTRSDEDGELNCPTCNNRFGLYIYQCASGHSSCKDCKEGNVLCGICHDTITNMRNITLEAYIAEIKTPCANVNDGCTLMFKQSDMEFHLKECPFKEMRCPVAEIGNCNWRGKLSQIAAHFRDVHPRHCQGEINKEMLLIISDSLEEEKQLHFIQFGSFHFLVHLKLSKMSKMIYVTVQLIGTEMSAKKWDYELHIYSKRRPRIKYQYTDSCHSSSTPVEEIFKESKCATIPLQYASNFICNYCITYKFFIKKQCDSNKKVFRKQRTRSAGRPNKNREF